MQTYQTTLLKKIELAPAMLELHFSRPEGFEYEAGQFVQFLVPDGEKTVPRAYSLCSTPADAHLAFCVKILPDGKASTMFSNMNEGDEATMRGPRGKFTCPSEHDMHLVATGAGIAPIIGIIKDELQNKQSDKHMHLLFGVRHNEDMFWEAELDALAEQYQNFSYQMCLSKPNETWDGLAGHVTEHVPTNKLSDAFYLCGSPAMVKDVRTKLVDAGVDKSLIHFEIF